MALGIGALKRSASGFLAHTVAATTRPRIGLVLGGGDEAAGFLEPFATRAIDEDPVAIRG